MPQAPRFSKHLTPGGALCVAQRLSCNYFGRERWLFELAMTSAPGLKLLLGPLIMLQYRIFQRVSAIGVQANTGSAIHSLPLQLWKPEHTPGCWRMLLPKVKRGHWWPVCRAMCFTILAHWETAQHLQKIKAFLPPTRCIHRFVARKGIEGLMLVQGVDVGNALCVRACAMPCACVRVCLKECVTAAGRVTPGKPKERNIGQKQWLPLFTLVPFWITASTRRSPSSFSFVNMRCEQRHPKPHLE
eukprot:1161034-Pelagomonas_calceolata.AAC.13